MKKRMLDCVAMAESRKQLERKKERETDQDGGVDG